MKTVHILTAVALSVGLIASASASPVKADKVTKRTSVNYSCQGGKRVTVNYSFNAAGVPVAAAARLNGKTRVMKYDLNNSDSVGSFFQDANGYRLGGDAIDSSNVRNAGMMITSPRDEILFKSCSAR